MVPSNTTSAPYRLAPSIFTSGAVVGITMTARTPSTCAASASDWPWFPDEYVMTPARFSGSDSRASMLYAPRILKAPDGWRFSHFTASDGTPAREEDRETSRSGVTRAIGRTRSRACSMSDTDTSWFTASWYQGAVTSRGASSSLFSALVGNRLNVLLVAAPVTWVLALTRPDSPWLFVLAAVSILPLAGAIGDATNVIAHRTGPTLGGLLNATFGNAAELIIGVVAIRAHHVDLVKASITGSIIGNLLVVLGLSMFLGGLGRQSQQFDRLRAGNATIMLFLGVVALVMPAVFDLTVFGTLDERPPVLFRLGLWTSVLLVLAYCGSLIYTFTMKRDLLRSEHPLEGPMLGIREAITLLAIATVAMTIQAELLVDGLGPVFKEFGITELFSGVIIVAAVGTAAEYYSAVRAAMRDRMTLATEIAIGSAAQIALLVGPVLVIVSFAVGDPMTLLFHPLEIAAISLSVVATAIVALDGESNWVEGVQLLALYAVLGIVFYLVPQTG